MGGPTVAVAVFACLISSAMVGVFAHTRLPSGTSTSRAVSMLRGGIGLIAVMAGIMLVLLTMTLKRDFDDAAANVRQFAAEVTELDHSLRRIGPQAAPARALLFRFTARSMKDLWPATTPPLGPDDAQASRLFASLEDSLAALRSPDPARRDLEVQARGELHTMVAARWKVAERAGRSVSPWMLAILVFWLMLTFASAGFSVSRSPTTLTILGLGALALAGAMFLVVEYADPYEGVIVVSSEPVSNALFALSD